MLRKGGMPGAGERGGWAVVDVESETAHPEHFKLAPFKGVMRFHPPSCAARCYSAKNIWQTLKPFGT